MIKRNFVKKKLNYGKNIFLNLNKINIKLNYAKNFYWYENKTKLNLNFKNFNLHIMSSLNRQLN